MERGPRPGAVVLTRDAAGVFTICDSAGVPQIVCDTFQELLQLAVHFTADRRAYLWYAGRDGRTRPVTDAALLQRVWSVFVENPGRRITREQAPVLWEANAEACRAALDVLVALRLAAHNGHGEYASVTPQS